ncbi:MAG: hypothetical protein KatS3mg105_2145 [Gemmatales bacterium]|nr:MAG: hypothetical protein KatS3mg105_2145 [Gemmatales bacterium]
MTATLKMTERLLRQGRRYQALGQQQEAIQLFRRLTTFESLPPAIAEESRSRLAEIYLSTGRYAKARRVLAALLAQCPENARYHYWMATALNNDEFSDPNRAAEHYEESLRLRPTQADCLADYGLLLLRLGEPKRGLDHLRSAVEMAPDDVGILERLIQGLCEEGEVDEARRQLRLARFRRPRCSALRKLQNDFEFEQLRQTQIAKWFAGDVKGQGPRIVIPFAEAQSAPGPRRVRRDKPHAPPPPHSSPTVAQRHQPVSGRQSQRDSG